MSESLRVELNRETVHAIDAPDAFTAEGPFHIELHNAGGAVHVHLHLDDDLSRVSRLDDVNHYVEEGATKRVPVGVLPNRDSRRGRLKIVSGYGAEEMYVSLTVVPKSNRRAASGGNRREDSGSGSGSDTARRSPGANDPRSGETATTDRTGEADQEVATGGTGTIGGTAVNDGRTTTGGTATANRPSPTVRNDDGGADHGSSVDGDAGPADASMESEVSASPSGSRPQSASEGQRDALGLESLRSVVTDGLQKSPEAVTFLALALVAVVVGGGVIAVVDELLLALVVAAVVAGAVAVAGWLLLQ